jgi:putative membrane protein
MKDEQSIRKLAERDVDPRVDLAVERTILAMERTQLAWVRTVMGLITAGIAIDKGLSAMHQARLLAGVAWEENGHFAGLLLTIGGTAMMAFATILYILRLRELTVMRGLRNKLPQPGVLISIFLCIVGGLAIYSLTFAW